MKCVRWISWLGMAGMVVVLVGGCSGKDRNETATSEPTPEAQSSATDEGLLNRSHHLHPVRLGSPSRKWRNRL